MRAKQLWQQKQKDLLAEYARLRLRLKEIKGMLDALDATVELAEGLDAQTEKSTTDEAT